ncbi:DNA polymerase [Campylobacter hyointestinalis]|uniref:DNA polymerase n=1 Tax=Campylobacter hyointestinalis TaxID=198 RepID=UPI000CE347AA|nr:DNA polymerase [Campylobacter hyointestinalis]PPB54633.1 hypothetical protein CDQ67_07535 [Campylobacter hyointestinalis subsp. hyointestinalis]
MTTDEVLNLVKEYLKISKDLSMLLDGSSSFIHCYNSSTHRLHSKVDTLGAGTARMTHTSPNITQLSKDKEFRELLCVPDGKVLIDVDASALELATLGYYLAPFDDFEFAYTVAKGDKSKGTDIHTLNQKRVGLPSRDAAKTFIYSVNYGAGATKVGNSIWDKKPFDYSKDEYDKAKDQVLKRVVKIDNKDFFPISKGVLSPFSEELILATIYGNRILVNFRDNTKGYNELLEWCIRSVKDNKIKAIDGRLLYLRSPHKALNLYLQSAGAIFMKYLLCDIDNKLKSKFKDKFGYVANIHDAINIECYPEVAEDICEILRASFIDTSYKLGFKYPIEGEPKIGKNQYETH